VKKIIGGHKIITSFDYPPIPERHSDWSAVFDGYDGAEDAHDIIGRGPTELSAIADLLEQDRERTERVDETLQMIVDIAAAPWKAHR
jgi:hypothetical protein